MATLILDQLCKVYGDNYAVDHIDLNIAPGSFLALLGPSGCGKTTILRMIAGFETATSGRIALDGHILTHPEQNIHIAPEHRQMGMVFQAYALWPHMSVYDNIAYPLKIQGMKSHAIKQAVQAIAERTGLTPYLARAPKDLSGGQQQRVALARCLVNNPKIVLLDEPLANLDRHLRLTMEETFRDMNKDSGATFIYVTHDQSEAMALANDIAVLNNGRLQQCASPQALYQTPTNAWVASFIGEGGLIELASEQITGLGCYIYGEELQSAASNAALSKQTVLAHIRPQKIALSEQGLPAIVQSCIFRGERYALELQLDNGNVIRAYHHSPLTKRSTCKVRLQEAWILPDQTDYR